MAQAAVFITTAFAMLGAYYGYDCIAPVAELLSRQLGLSDAQIGSLNAVYSLPNIVMALVGGIQVDRFGARAVIIATALASFLGAVLTAISKSFIVMMLGRLVFGLGAETMMVAILVALAQWFSAHSLALVMALNLSVARFGSYLADRSPSLAPSVYEHGWQWPLWLAACMAGVALAAATCYAWVDNRETERGSLAVPQKRLRITWHSILGFPAAYWYVVGLCVAFYSAIFPFRSTFAIKYFQQARGLSLEDASRMNSYVFMAAIIAMPAFGLLADRFFRSRALFLTVGALLLPASFVCFAAGFGLWIPTVLLGISFSLVPAVLWPSVAQYVEPESQGMAYGLLAMLQNTGLTVANLIAGYLNDQGAASAIHPEGYASMFWFFGSVSLVGFAFAALLNLRQFSSR